MVLIKCVGVCEDQLDELYYGEDDPANDNERVYERKVSDEASQDEWFWFPEAF